MGVQEGKEGNACRQTPSVCQRTSLTCVHRTCRLAEEGEACFQKFIAERGFSREYQQYGGNPVV